MKLQRLYQNRRPASILPVTRIPLLLSFLLLGAMPLTAQDEPDPRQVVLSIPDCVAFWDFNESTGDAVSIAPAGSTLHEADGSVARIDEGPFGRSIDLREGAAHFATPSDELPELNIYKGGDKELMTVVAWIKPVTTRGFIAGKWAEGLDGSYSQGQRQYGLFIGLDGSNQVIGHVSLTGDNTPGYPYNNDKSYSGQVIPAGVWSCVAFTYDGSYIRSYFDGVFEANGDRNPYAYTDGAGDNGADFTVGRNEYRGTMGNTYRGLIGGIAVYSRPLTATELLTLAEVGSGSNPVPEANPVFLTDQNPVYEQDFDSLSADNGFSSPWIDGATLQGWHALIDFSAAQSYLSWNGTDPKQAQLLSLGSSGDPDRALGGQTNNSGGQLQFGLVLRNASGTGIDYLRVTYDAEQWRSVQNDALDYLNVECQVFPAGEGSLAALSGWQSLNALQFASPITGTVTLALDGNLPANRSEGLSTLVTGLNWAPGDDLWIRWSDATAERQMMGIDNVRIEAILPPRVELSLTAEGDYRLDLSQPMQPEFTYSVQGGSDLTSWQELDFEANPSNDYLTVDKSSAEGSEAWFMRMEITPPAAP